MIDEKTESIHKPKVSVIWFKRDLRVHDHEPLMRALSAGHPIIPLYVVEPDLWQPHISAPSLAFYT